MEGFLDKGINYFDVRYALKLNKDRVKIVDVDNKQLSAKMSGDMIRLSSFMRRDDLLKTKGKSTSMYIVFGAMDCSKLLDDIDLNSEIITPDLVKKIQARIKTDKDIDEHIEFWAYIIVCYLFKFALHTSIVDALYALAKENGSGLKSKTKKCTLAVLPKCVDIMFDGGLRKDLVTIEKYMTEIWKIIEFKEEGAATSKTKGIHTGTSFPFQDFRSKDACGDLTKVAKVFVHPKAREYAEGFGKEGQTLPRVSRIMSKGTRPWPIVELFDDYAKWNGRDASEGDRSASHGACHAKIQFGFEIFLGKDAGYLRTIIMEALIIQPILPYFFKLNDKSSIECAADEETRMMDLDAIDQDSSPAGRRELDGDDDDIIVEDDDDIRHDRNESRSRRGADSRRQYSGSEVSNDSNGSQRERRDDSQRERGSVTQTSVRRGQSTEYSGRNSVGGSSKRHD